MIPTMNAHPAAYLRRSYVDPDSPGDISREVQRAAVRRLAEGDGHNGNVVEYDDWGVSADVAKAGKRIAYTRLLADMEAGKVSAVYAFDVDRLYRDPRDLIRLQDAAQRHNVRITTTAGTLAVGDGDDPAAEAFAFIGAVFGRMELGKAKKRARAAREARVARGDRFGHPPFGYRHERDEAGRIVRIPDPSQPLQAVLDAYREAGSILGACGRLEAAGIPAPKGGKRWATSLVTRIIEREAPELLPRKTAAGRRTPTRAILAQLVRCPFCEKMLTPNAHRGQLYCSNGARDRATHPRYVVREADLMPWVMAKAEEYRPPEVVDLPGDDPGARLADLDARRQRV
ncbi:MAG TPA: recombinase family protein, partial [Candidatus Limnocylindria bacterium]|nr:recombinase family protein [Candidatus Limnocylindria bacterium]